MYCKDSDFFELLTAEEQLEDIKEYWYNSNVEDIDGLLEWLSDHLYTSSMPDSELAARLSHTKIAFQRGTSEDILTVDQKRDLEYDGFTIVPVMASQYEVFEFWCRVCGFKYRMVVQHKIDAREYKIWKDEEE